MGLPWKIHGNGKIVGQSTVVLPNERLSWPRTIGVGAQHVVAMFGGTFLVPLLTHFPPNTTLFFSGLGTLLFLIITKNRLPSYLGSSFAFIAPITAATAVASPAHALFAIICVGFAVTLIGLLVQLTGTHWIDKTLPPVVAGTIVALIGFNLAPVAKANFMQAPLSALITLITIIVSTAILRGLLGRLAIFLGVMVGYATALLLGEVDFSAVGQAALFGLPPFLSPANPFVDPTSSFGILPAFLPLIVVLVAENVGHIRGVAQMTDSSVNKLTGRALIADGLATMLAGCGGGSGTTTYGENIGVMAATRIYSTAAYWVAGIFAIFLGLSPKVGAIINSIPAGVLGGVTTALYGLIGIIGMKIWIDHKVNFNSAKNQFTAAVGLVIGVADFECTIGVLHFNGIALGTIAAVLIYHAMNWLTHLRGTH